MVVGPGQRWARFAELDNIDDALDLLNSKNDYDIKNVLTDFFGDDNDENSFLSDSPINLYYDSDSFTSTFSHNSNIFLSLNVCSLMSKHQNLNDAIQSFIRKNVSIKIMAIQETWDIPYPELVNIKGFKLILKTRSIIRGGGVAFYVKDEIPCKIVNNLTVFIEKEFECLTVEIVLNRKKITLSNIYRSPTPTANLTQAEHSGNFINHLDVHLFNLAQLNHDSYVFLDSNINLLKLNHNQTAALYLETIFSNGFLQKIGKATRISGNSFSLIDHVLTKTNENVESSGVILTDISDHFMTFVAVPSAKSKMLNETKPKRNFSKTNLRRFKDDLGNCNWNNVTNCNEVNVSYEKFWDVFHTLFELHFPLIKVKLNRNVHNVNNFMTKGLLISRKNKNLLQKKPYLNRNFSV